LPRLKAGKDLHTGHLGISFASQNLHVEPPLIVACHPRSPASAAGLKPGDKIVRIDSRPIDRAAQVKEEISRRYSGDKLRLVVLRGPQRLERNVELAESLPPYAMPLLGILPLRAAGGSAKSDAAAGVAVRYVYPDSAAEKAGIRRGDVVAAINGHAVKDRDELLRQMADFQAGDEVRLQLRRDGRTLPIAVRLGNVPEGLPPAELPPAELPSAEIPSAEPSPAPAQPAVQGGKSPPRGMFKIATPDFPHETWIYVPENYRPALACGVVLWLHGRGGFEPEMATPWKSYCQRYGLIFVAPKAADATGWHSAEVPLLEKLLAEVRSRYAVDPNRIVVHGYESGGELAYLVAFRNRELIRGVAAVEAAPERPPVETASAQNDPAHRLAFYVAAADKSPVARLVQMTVAILRTMKYPVTVKSLGPQPRYLEGNEIGELARWIDMLDRI
jgi:hypothetical protein